MNDQPTVLVTGGARDFVPRHSDLPTLIRTAWAWHQKAHPLKAR